HPITIIAGALLFALVLCLGWIGGLNSDFVIIKPASPPAKKVDADPPDPAKSGRLAMQDSSAKTSTAVTSSAHEASRRGRLPQRRNRLWSSATPNAHQCQRRGRQPSRGGPYVKLMAVRRSLKDRMADGKGGKGTRYQAEEKMNKTWAGGKVGSSRLAGGLSPPPKTRGRSRA